MSAGDATRAPESKAERVVRMFRDVKAAEDRLRRVFDELDRIEVAIGLCKVERADPFPPIWEPKP